MKILVTGGFGAIGSYLVKALLEHGHHVVVLDLASAPDLLASEPHMETIRGSVLEPWVVAEAAAGCEAVYHMIWLARHSGPLSVVTDDLLALRYVLDAAVRQRVRHFVYGSSIIIYGDRPPSRFDENSPPRPASSGYGCYAVAKAAGEEFTFLAQRLHKLPVSVVRIGAVNFGLWLGRQNVLNHELAAILQRAPGDASCRLPADRWLNVIHREDAGRALAAMLGNEKTLGQIFNLVGFNMSFDEAIRRMLVVVGRDPNVAVDEAQSTLNEAEWCHIANEKFFATVPYALRWPREHFDELLKHCALQVSAAPDHHLRRTGSDRAGR